MKNPIVKASEKSKNKIRIVLDVLILNHWVVWYAMKDLSVTGDRKNMDLLSEKQKAYVDYYHEILKTYVNVVNGSTRHVSMAVQNTIDRALEDSLLRRSQVHFLLRHCPGVRKCMKTLGTYELRSKYMQIIDQIEKRSPELTQ